MRSKISDIFIAVVFGFIFGGVLLNLVGLSDRDPATYGWWQAVIVPTVILWSIAGLFGYIQYRWMCKLERPRQAVCKKCGYNLRGNVSGVCPECGKSL